jgi:ElaB/YqjD/DUF883 family membrane-anchored ribosome-binding protein
VVTETFGSVAGPKNQTTEIMEVYFENFASDEGVTDKLLHDLSLAKEGAEELFAVAGQEVAEQSKEKFLSGLDRVKAACRNLQGKAANGARVADKAIHEHPYATAGIALGVGLLLGALILKRVSGADDSNE